MNRSLLAITTLLAGFSILLAGPSEDETKRIQGIWEVASLIESGEVIPIKTVRDTLIRDGVITIEGNMMKFYNPGTNKKREIAFVLNPDQSPKSVDMTASDKVGSKGIYLLDGNSLLLCLCNHDSNERPTYFASTPLNKSSLFSLRRIVPGSTPDTSTTAKPVSQTTEKTTPPATTPVTPPVTPPIVKPTSDETLKKALIGTWGHQDDERIETFTMNSDGSFSSTWTYKKFFPKVFKGEERCSGTWKLQDGVIISYITSSTDDHIRNQVFSYRVSWYTQTEIALIDQKGRIHRDWKINP